MWFDEWIAAGCPRYDRWYVRLVRFVSLPIRNIVTFEWRDAARSVGMLVPPRRHRQRRAMTIIELLVSAVLAALMMVVISSIVWTSARETRQLALQASRQFPTTQLVQQLRVDLINSRGLLIDPQGITLHGFLGSDPVSELSRLTPGRIRYELVQIANSKVLMRTTPQSREPVWVGCETLRIESLDQVDPEAELLPQPESGGLPDIPSRFRITMVGDDGRILWKEVIHHHDG